MPLAGKVFPPNFWIIGVRDGFRYVVNGVDGRIDLKFEPDFLRLTISLRIGSSLILPSINPSSVIYSLEHQPVAASVHFKIGDVICNRLSGKLYVIANFNVYNVPPKVPYALDPITKKRTVRVSSTEKCIINVSSFPHECGGMISVEGKNFDLLYVRAKPLEVYAQLGADGKFETSVASLSVSKWDLRVAEGNCKALRSIISIICQNDPNKWQQRLFSAFTQATAYYNAAVLNETAAFLQLDAGNTFLSRLVCTLNALRPVNALKINDADGGVDLPAKRVAKRKLSVDV